MARSAKDFVIYSWNVNGIRSCERKGFGTWLGNLHADVVGLQEVRAKPEQISDELRDPEDWNTVFSVAEKPGYSGVGVYSRLKPEKVERKLRDVEIDAEGRLLILQFGALKVVNGYFPNGKGSARDNSRVPFKLRFYEKLFNKLKAPLKRGEAIIVMGDLNTAHQSIDLARPKANEKVSGFLPAEREEITRWTQAGWVDTFRHFNQEPDNYTWWSQRAGARQRNVGWRIDYILASPGAMPHLKKAEIHAEVMGSDHCPISVTLSSKVLTA